VAIAVLVRTVPGIDRVLLVPAPHFALVDPDAVMRDMRPWPATTGRQARRVARQFAEARAVDPERAQQDTVRGRTRIDRALLAPAPHSTLVGLAVMQDVGP
jgi:hypothetical protein